MKQRENKVFKSQKEYLRYLRWRRKVVHIITICSVILLFLYIITVNPHSIGAWIVFLVYILFMVILSYRAEQEYLRQDKDVANKKAQEKLAHENKKRLDKQHYK